MKSIKSIFYLFILISLSSNMEAQKLSLSIDQFQINNTESKSLITLSNFSKPNSINSDTDVSNSIMTLNEFDHSYTKYLELSKTDTRFNLNFTKVDPCSYSGTGDVNLSLIRNGYDPYYHNSNYRPNFFEDMVCSVVRSFLSNLR